MSPARMSPWDSTVVTLLAISVFFSSWNLLRIGTINFTLADLTMLTAMAIVLAQGRLNRQPFGSVTPFWIGGLVAMLGGLFVSSVANGDPLRWVNVAAQYTMAYLAMPMLLMSCPAERMRRLTLMFVLGVTLSQAIGIMASFLFSFNDVASVLGDGFITGNGRVGAMAGEPNPNGASVAFAMPMLLYCLRSGILRPVAAVLCGGILCWGLMLSASFTGFSATALAAVITLGLFGLRYLVRLGLILAVALGIFVASGAPLPATFQERVGDAVESGNIDQAGTFVNRAELMEEAWRFAENNTFIGLGVDQYRVISAHDNPVHDLYLLIWNEGGGIALAGLMTMLCLLVALSVGGIRRYREEGAMALAITVVFLVYATSYPHMYSRNWLIPVMLALSTIYGRRSHRA